MAKLALLLATFALVLFLANASIYRTTISVDDEDDESGSWDRGCQPQIQKQNYLRHCQRYMEEQFSRRDNRPGSGHLDSCCEQLEQLDRQCRCPGLRQAVRQQVQQGQLGSEEIREVFQVAERIMNKCEVEPRKCGFQPRSWF